MSTRALGEAEGVSLVSLGEIKELAEVGRPTVSNWRRRFSKDSPQLGGDRRPPFPDPVGGSGSRPLFDAEDVAAWLDLRLIPDAEPDEDGSLPTYGDRFRRGLRLRGLVALRHELGSAERLITDALAVCAMAGQGDDQRAKALSDELLTDVETADLRVARAVRQLIGELGSPGAAADTVLGLAERLESDLITDMTPFPLAELISRLAGPLDVVSPGSDQPAVINLCAGTGELLFGLGDIRGHEGILAVEPDPLRRKLISYRLLAHHCSGVNVCADPEELDTLRPSAQRNPDPGPERPSGTTSGDVVIADPPYAAGEREFDDKGPLSWALEAVRRLNPGGRGLVVVPSWTLSRPRGATPTPNARMREELLSRDVVAAVIQLPRRTHRFRTGAEHALLVLRNEAAPDSRGRVLLVDADRIARRVGGAWPEYVAKVLEDGRSPTAEEARDFPVSATRLRGEALLDGRSVLPAHRLGTKEQGLDHFAATLDARREAATALPQLKEWIGDLGVARRVPGSEVTHRRVGEHLRAGQIRLLAGHRIRESDIGDAGLMVVGREEMLGTLPLGQRRIALEDLAEYPQAQTTERGDVFLLTEHGVRTLVDDAGGCVLLAPVQGLRIPAYREFLAGKLLPEEVWMRPHPLAQLLAAPRNQHRGSGSLVRRVSVRDMDLPGLAPEEVAELEAILKETDRQRADVRRQLAALDNLALRLAAGVADGDLALRRRPGRA
ncbi:N-6 DNA methylase [Kitasatospora aureofaciens]|uniref:N-6 DNA methylase n=1 Tax=Kitasatospora aureofaciens TaxID=1894 RepID=UPI001D9E5CC7|nr:N-6 DNA methylase [Kitasatospora aureofaciens]HJD80773.1 SAM-dependent methyltransferase [Kitasatospora aureofaciens]